VKYSHVAIKYGTQTHPPEPIGKQFGPRS